MGASSGSYNYSPKNSKTPDKIFKQVEDKAQKKISDYQKKTQDQQRNVFVSFDMEDHGKMRLMISQAKNDRFPFSFRDYSVKEPFEKQWKEKVKERISQTSAIIVGIGENTHNSNAVNWEIEEAHRQGKKVIGVKLNKNRNYIIPKALIDHGDKIISWNAKEIEHELE